jgi:hypothetical protein
MPLRSTPLLTQPIAIGYFVSWFSPFNFENINALIDGSSDGTWNNALDKRVTNRR